MKISRLHKNLEDLQEKHKKEFNNLIENSKADPIGYRRNYLYKIAAIIKDYNDLLLEVADFGITKDE